MDVLVLFGKLEEDCHGAIYMEVAGGEKEKQERKSDGRYDYGDEEGLGGGGRGEGEKTKIEGIIVGKVRQGRGVWRVVGVYMNGDMESKLEKLRGCMEEKEDDVKTINGGDFDARTGREGGVGR